MSCGRNMNILLAGTFGKVIPIGGHASDLALDEARGVLYIANFTANRIEVMTRRAHDDERVCERPVRGLEVSASPECERHEGGARRAPGEITFRSKLEDSLRVFESSGSFAEGLCVIDARGSEFGGE